MAAIPCAEEKFTLKSGNAADTKEALVASSYHMVSVNRMPGSAPSKRAMLPRAFYRQGEEEVSETRLRFAQIPWQSQILAVTDEKDGAQSVGRSAVENISNRCSW